MMGVEVQFVKEGDVSYPSVCNVAGDIYQKHLNLRPLQYPPEFVIFRDQNGQQIGGGGIHCPSKGSELLVQKLLKDNKGKACEYLESCGAEWDRGWAEITCFHCTDGMSRFIPYMLGHIYTHLNSMDYVQTTLNVLTRPLRRPLKQIGAQIIDLSGVNCDLLTDLPADFLEAFKLNYLTPARNPTCVGISVQETAESFLEYCRQNPL